MAQKFMGMKITQTWEDLGIWELFFDSYNVRTFIEFGSGHGGSSLFFALHCLQRNIEFHTYDNQTNFDLNSGLCGLVRMKDSFHNINIFGEEPYESQAIGTLIENCAKPLCIFFDNGDKPREWKLYAPHTKPGDFCAVHDWGTEFMESDIGGIPVERILVNESDQRRKENNWRAMWFRRI